MFELKDFQQKTVDYIYDRLLRSDCQRFLCADEVGLGKTIIAKGVIDKYLQLKGGNLKVFYICSNQYLAQQNLKKLHPESQEAPISRLTELILKGDLIQQKTGLTILPLSPKTSVDLKSKGGMMYERAIIYQLLKKSDLLKGRRETTYARVLRLGITDSRWDEIKDRFSFKEFDPNVVQSFYQKLNNDSGLIKLLNDCFDEVSQEYASLIGKLRLLLATSALESLKPDIIILDEFQRFSEILKMAESEDASDLIKALFLNHYSEMLMLSATPYKMYTVREEDASGDSHYQEFDFLMRFLMRTDYEAFSKDWATYTEAILSLRMYTPEEIEILTNRVEKWLYKYMCRTERNIVYEFDPHKSLLESKYFDLPFESGDVANFINADNIVKCIEEKHPEIYSPLEYSKTVPFPLSFMDSYKLKNLFRDLYEGKENNMREAVQRNNAFISYDVINQYGLSNFNNAKMNWLVGSNVKKGAHMLWIPPTVTYYKLSGPFADNESFSKLMIFGRFAVEPRAIATMASYAAELFSTGSSEATLANKEEVARKYFSSATVEASPDDAIEEDMEEKKKYSRIPRRRLYFKKDDSSYSLYCFYYPSIYLSSLLKSKLKIEPEKIGEEVIKDIQIEIDPVVNDLAQYVIRPTAITDARWYFFALIYLDFTNESEAFGSLSTNKIRSECKESLNHTQLNPIIDAIEKVRKNGLKKLAEELDLGEMPLDLTKVLATIALGAPGTLAFYTLRSLTYTSSEIQREKFSNVFAYSMVIAESFRSYFNQPESISCIDLYKKESSNYWLSLMEYSIAGCLIAVMEECFYMFCDGNYQFNEANKKVIIDFAKYLSSVLSLRTSTLNVDMEDSNKKVAPQGMRTHYAVAFLDLVETDESISRKGDVQNAFNSPFRPFILSTTSIGQEGLDFHKYCRQLLHWSLPGNAIDLEQREGRINRYKHFALRRNLADRYKDQIKGESIKEPVWSRLFDIAEKDHLLRSDNCQLIPYWHVPKISLPLERLVPMYPYSKDSSRLEHLLKTLMVYRMSLGQPNQEDLVRFLLKNFTEAELEVYKAKMMINLSPVAYSNIQVNAELPNSV